MSHHLLLCGCSIHRQGCEWDTGLHYTSVGLSSKTQRPGALLHFMTKGLQRWVKLTDPYDEVIFPDDINVKEGCPNNSKYAFVTGKENTVDSIITSIDPGNEGLKKKALIWMDLCQTINDGFTALGISRVLPTWLRFLVKNQIDQLYTFASYSVRDVQFAIFNLGYSKVDLLQGCPKAPEGPEPDLSIRRLKAVLTHPSKFNSLVQLFRSGRRTVMTHFFLIQLETMLSSREMLLLPPTVSQWLITCKVLPTQWVLHKTSLFEVRQW